MVLLHVILTDLYRWIILFLIAALIFSAGYYSASNFLLQFKEFELYWGAVFFLQFKEFELYWGAVFFTTRRVVLEKSFFNQFYWIDFEAGNETREKIWSDFGAEQK